MSIDINEPQRWSALTSGNIIYQWWCPRCKYSHTTPYCPCDEIYEPNISIKTGVVGCDGAYEFCPHCGQLIKEEARQEIEPLSRRAV